MSEQPPKLTKLHVNLNQESADALLAYAERRGISVTESVRRMVSLAHYIDEVVANDGRIETVVDGRRGEVIPL